jgi:predicted kinase
MHPSPSPTLVLVSGKPGAGKSTLARQLAAEGALWLPLIACDPLRNGIRTTMAGEDGIAAPRPGKEAVELFYDTIAFLLARRVSLIAELSLRRGLDEANVLSLMPRCRIRNIHCDVASPIARQRFLDRQGLRIGGANEASTISKAMIGGSFDWAVFDPLDLPVSRLVVDTAAGYAPTLEQVLDFCRR